MCHWPGVMRNYSDGMKQRDLIFKQRGNCCKLPAVMVYLLRRNDLGLLAGGECVMASTLQIEKTRSEELRRLRAEVEAFSFDKQNWAIQCNGMQRKMAESNEQDLTRSQDYAKALEACCGKVGLPISAIRRAVSVVSSDDMQEESDDEEVTALVRESQGGRPCDST